MVSREVYKAAVEAYERQCSFRRSVARQVQELMGIPGPFVSKEQHAAEKSFLELIIAAVEDTHGITKKWINNEGFDKDNYWMISVPMVGDEAIEFYFEDLDDAYDCIAALNTVR